jgi:hypothetical protein
MLRIIAGALVGAALIAGGAQADSHMFEVHNLARTPIKSFQTQERGEWSGNWLRGALLGPNRSSVMDFGTTDGLCVVRTEITFTDNTYFDYDVDYCGSYHLYIHDDKVTAD